MIPTAPVERSAVRREGRMPGGLLVHRFLRKSCTLTSSLLESCRLYPFRKTSLMLRWRSLASQAIKELRTAF